MGQCGCGIFKALICLVLVPCFMFRAALGMAHVEKGEGDGGGGLAAVCGLATAFVWPTIDYCIVIFNALMSYATLPGSGLPWGFRANDDNTHGHWTAGTVQTAQTVALIGLFLNLCGGGLWNRVRTMCCETEEQRQQRELRQFMTSMR